MESNLEKKMKESKGIKDLTVLRSENYKRMIEMNNINAQAAKLQQSINEHHAQIEEIEKENQRKEGDENVDRS